MADRPPTIYKYESLNVRSLMNLKAQSLYFGSPLNFNDPFDCAITATVAEPSYDQLEIVKKHFLSDPSFPAQGKQQLQSLQPDELRQKLVNIARKEITAARDKFVKTRGVTCFSERNDNLLMWAHYGGKYKGFCLEFNTDKQPFTKLRQVQYVDAIPQFEIANFISNSNHDKLFDDLYCIKSTSWKYEKEWRAAHAEAGTLFTYEADALRAIYFGPDIEELALEIVCLIIQGQNSNVRFHRGKRSETEFKVEFEKITYTPYIEAKRKGLV